MKPAKIISGNGALLQAAQSAQLSRQAMTLYEQGNPAAAVPLFERALTLSRQNAQALHFLGLCRHQLKDDERAIALLRESVKTGPQQTSYFVNLALVLSETGNWAEALSVLESAPRAGNALPDLFNTLGQVREQLGDLPGAIAEFQRALELRPVFPFALNNLGGALSRSGRFSEAVHAFELALRMAPRSPVIMTNLGRALALAGQSDPAAARLRDALELDPANADAALALCRLLEETGQLDDAMLACQTALNSHPASVPLWMQKGELLRRMGDYAGAKESLDHAAAAAPRSFAAQWRSKLALPVIYESEEQMDSLRAQWMDGVGLLALGLENGAFDGPPIAPATNFHLHYHCRDDRQAQAAYGKLVAAVAARQAGALPAPARPPLAGRKIRVGFVSAFFTLHTISKLFHGWIANLDPDIFETFVFNFSPVRDKATERLAGQCSRLVSGAFPLRAAAGAVLEAGLDILIYTDIGMDAMTQTLAGLRLAPIQCQAWGHPVTSGLPAIDYFLSSDLMEPQDGQTHYNETLVRLPGLSICYAEPDRSVAIPAPGFPESGGRMRYACLQSLFKLLPEQDRLFAEIAARVPESLLALISHPAPKITAQYRQRLESAFRQRGVDPDRRLLFLPPLRYGEFLGLARDADAILDSVGWSGGNTTLEAIAFGAPVVTCPGPLMRGRHTAAILRHIGVEDTIARSPEEYASIAVRCAEDSSWRQSVKERVLERAPLAYGNEAPVRALEHLFAQWAARHP